MAIENGGAVSSVTNCQIIFDSDTIIFQNNRAGIYGGAVYIDSSMLKAMGDIEYRSNNAEHGGAIFVTSTGYQNGNVEIYRDCNFIDNEARENGGAISSNKNSQVNFYGSTVFQKNHAGIHGGGIYSLNSRIFYHNMTTGPITSTEYTFNENSAAYGGAIASQVMQK